MDILLKIQRNKKKLGLAASIRRDTVQQWHVIALLFLRWTLLLKLLFSVGYVWSFFLWLLAHKK